LNVHFTLKVEKQRHCTVKYKVKVKFTVLREVTLYIILLNYLRFGEVFSLLHWTQEVTVVEYVSDKRMLEILVMAAITLQLVSWTCYI